MIKQLLIYRSRRQEAVKSHISEGGTYDDFLESSTKTKKEKKKKRKNIKQFSHRIPNLNTTASHLPMMIGE